MIRAAMFAVLVACSGKHDPKPILQQDVDQAVASPELDTTSRVHGFVEPGSIHSEVRDTVLNTDFTLAKAGARLPVHLTGPLPDTFRDEVELTATGKLTRSGSGALRLEATEMKVAPPRF